MPTAGCQHADIASRRALGLNMTRPDLQNAEAAEKKPWEIGKSFDHAAVLGPIHPVSKVGHLTKVAISLAVGRDQAHQAIRLQRCVEVSP